MTKDIASGQSVDEIVEQHLATGDKPAAIGALLAWSQKLRDAGKTIDAAAAEERARAIDPMDARHAPVSRRASGLASSQHAVIAAKVAAPAASVAPKAPVVPVVPSAPPMVLATPKKKEDEVVDEEWSDGTSPKPGPTVNPAASATAPPAAGPTTPPAAGPTSPPAAGPTAPPAAGPTSPPASPAAAATAPPLVSPAPVAAPPTPAGPEIFDFGTNPPPPMNAAASAPSEAAKPKESAPVPTPAPPPPSDSLFEAEPQSSDDMFEEDLSDQTSIMGLEERRALQKATRAGDAALLKAAAEKIAADRDAADAASKNVDKKATKEDFERPTVPPPPDADEGGEGTTAPPPVADADAAPVLEVGEVSDADEEDGLSPVLGKSSGAGVIEPAAPGAFPLAGAAKTADRNFILFMIAAIVLLAIVAAVTLR